MKKIAAAVLAGSALALLPTAPAQAATVKFNEPMTCQVDPELPEYTFCTSAVGQANVVYKDNIYIYTGKYETHSIVTTPDGTFTNVHYQKFSAVHTKVGQATHSTYYHLTTDDWGSCLIEGTTIFVNGEVKHSIENVECTPAETA